MILGTAFRAGGRAYTRDEVLRAAEFRGDLEPIRKTASDGLVCQRYAEDEGYQVDLDALQRLSESYRHARSLTAADDTERWLEERSLTLTDFTAYLERRYWLTRFASQLATIRSEYERAAPDILDVIWPEAVFGDYFPGLARALAWRVAAAIHDGAEPGACPWMEELLVLEQHYLECCRCVLTAENKSRTLAGLRRALLRFEADAVSFETLDRAHEAFLCVSQDGVPLEQVARRAGARFESLTGFIDTFPLSLQQKALSAAPGETIVSKAAADDFRVYTIRRKIDPDLRDPAVTGRVERALLHSFFENLIRMHIAWEPCARGCYDYSD
jgi:hypothetical protein